MAEKKTKHIIQGSAFNRVKYYSDHLDALEKECEAKIKQASAALWESLRKETGENSMNPEVPNGWELDSTHADAGIYIVIDEGGHEGFPEFLKNLKASLIKEAA